MDVYLYEPLIDVPVEDRMALAIYVHSKFPELTIREVCLALDDPIFIIILLQTLKEICDG